jgi:hypothetical protein
VPCHHLRLEPVLRRAERRKDQKQVARQVPSQLLELHQKDQKQQAQ